jgi:hypothetical protein
MSLTGQPFRWLTIIVALAATIAAVLLWNRIRGPRPVRLAARAALLTTGYVTAAVAVLVSVNIAYGGLIASWGDLIDNLTPANGGWNQHDHHHRGPPGMWASHGLKPSVSSPYSPSAHSWLPPLSSQQNSLCAIPFRDMPVPADALGCSDVPD